MKAQTNMYGILNGGGVVETQQGQYQGYQEAKQSVGWANKIYINYNVPSLVNTDQFEINAYANADYYNCLKAIQSFQKLFATYPQAADTSALVIFKNQISTDVHVNDIILAHPFYFFAPLQITVNVEFNGFIDNFVGFGMCVDNTPSAVCQLDYLNSRGSFVLYNY